MTTPEPVAPAWPTAHLDRDHRRGDALGDVGHRAGLPRDGPVDLRQLGAGGEQQGLGGGAGEQPAPRLRRPRRRAGRRAAPAPRAAPRGRAGAASSGRDRRRRPGPAGPAPRRRRPRAGPAPSGRTGRARDRSVRRTSTTGPWPCAAGRAARRGSCSPASPGADGRKARSTASSGGGGRAATARPGGRRRTRRRPSPAPEGGLLARGRWWRRHRPGRQRSGTSTNGPVRRAGARKAVRRRVGRGVPARLGPAVPVPSPGVPLGLLRASRPGGEPDVPTVSVRTTGATSVCRSAIEDPAAGPLRGLRVTRAVRGQARASAVTPAPRPASVPIRPRRGQRAVCSDPADGAGASGRATTNRRRR